MQPPGPGKEKQLPGLKAVVEIGHGSRPLWTTLKKMPLHDQMYLGLDIDADDWPPNPSVTGFKYRIDEGRRKIDQRRAEGKNCYWMRIDGLGNLPLREATVDELHAVCVLSDPRISPPVVERLLESIVSAMKKGGHFVVDNFSTEGHLGAGDIMVDFGRGMSIFRLNGGDLREEELACRETALLNTAFTPLPSERYAGFLYPRGLDWRVDPEPGSRFSILVRR